MSARGMPMTSRALIFAIALLASAAVAQDRVRGAELLTEKTDARELIPQLLLLPIDAAEIEIFLDHSTPFAVWVKKHRRELDFGQAQDASGRIEALRLQPVWKSIGIGFEEFLALMLKLSLGLQVVELGKEVLIREMKAQEAPMLEVLARVNAIAEPRAEDLALKADLEKDLRLLRGLIEGFRQYPEANLEAIRAKKKAVAAALNEIQVATD